MHETLTRLARRPKCSAETIEIFRSVFVTAHTLGLALHQIEFQELRNKGEDTNSELEFKKFLKLYPPRSKSEEEERRRHWRNSKLDEVQQRQKAKKLVSLALALAEEVREAWNIPLVQTHLAEADANQLLSQLDAFSIAMDESMKKQPFQKDNFIRLKRSNLHSLSTYFRTLFGRPHHSLIADFAKLVSSKEDPDDRINGDSVKKEIRRHLQFGSLRPQNLTSKTPKKF
ncbi:MAG: hypothetical protein ACK5YZ_03040 [bacterium]